MKKFLSLFMSAVILVGTISGINITVSAEELTSGDFSYCVLSDNNKTAEISGYAGSEANLTIPSEIDGYAVTSIGTFAFTENTDLISVTLPNGIKNIGGAAFAFCQNITDIKLNSDLKYIADEVFFGCTSLLEITVPDNVFSIGRCAFGYQFVDGERPGVQVYGKIDDVVLKSATGGKAEEYANANNIAFVSTGTTTPSQPGVCGDYAYSILEDYTASITDYTGSETDLTLPATLDDFTVIEIGCGAFSENDDLLSVTIPDGIITIGAKAFFDCDSLMNVTMSDSLLVIGEGAFEWCFDLENIIIGNSVTNIGKKAFEWCYRLKSVTIPQSVTSISDEAFTRCEALENVYYKGTENEWKNISIGTYNAYLTDATIHYNVNGEHNYGLAETINPTCENQGEIIYRCPCGYEKKESIPATGHNFQDNKYCSVCGAANPNYKEPTAPVTTPTETTAPTDSTTQPTTEAQQETTTQKATTTMPASVKVSGNVYKLDKNGDYVSTKVKKPSISKTTKAKKSFKATWKKVSAVSGYEVQYSTSKKFTAKTTKTKTVKGNKSKTPSVTIKNLKSNKTYYVRIRTYKTTKVNGKTIKVYSSWSKTKSVKTK
ncbi:MAG: fibronectin type III domain-containing protein [Eubacterium sp.]